MLIDAKPLVSAEAGTSALPSIRDVFSNRPSAIAATEFLNGGSLARIPASMSSIDLLSLKKQAKPSLACPKRISATLLPETQISDHRCKWLDDGETVTFNIDHNAVKGFNGDWRNATRSRTC